MLGANIGQDVGRTIFVKDFYFNAVSLDTYLLYQTYQSSKWWMCLWWSQSNLSFCSHQIYICFGWSIMGDYYWVCLPGKTWLLWSNEKKPPSQSIMRHVTFLRSIIEVGLSSRSSSYVCSLFIYKRFALNKMFQRNTSKFAIFYV